MVEHSPIVAFFLFLLGAAAGSFANVLIWRLPRGESIISPPSHCPICGAHIRFYDNIPILSYIFLRGRCRACGAKISPQYIFVELLVAAAYTATYFIYSPTDYLNIIKTLLVFPIFVSIAVIDVRHWVIPDELTIAVAAVGVSTAPFSAGWRSMVDAVAGAALGALIFWAVAVLGKKAFRKEALGEGDIFLIAAVGTLVGWKGVLLTVFIAALLGALGGAVVIAIRKLTKSREGGTAIPFGPFIVTAALVSMVWGERLIAIYVRSVMRF